MKVEDVMSKKVVTVGKNQKMTDATTKMKKARISRVVVIDDGALYGILTKKDVARHLGSAKHGNRVPTSLHVSTVCITNPITIDMDASLSAAAKLMVKKGISSLVVMEASDIKGIITSTDIAKSLKGSQEQVSTIMGAVQRISPTDSIAHGRRVMMDNNVDRVMVVEKGQVVGILTQKDVATALETLKKRINKNMDQIMKISVEEIMTRDVFTLDSNCKVGEVCTAMVKRGISGVPIMDGGKLSGMVTKMEVLKILA